MIDDKWTVGKVLNWTSEYFKSKRLDSPTLSAQVLLAKVLSCSRIDLYLRFNEELSQAHRELLKEYIRRAVAGEPIAYIVGYKEFFSIPIKVNCSVLIPRPETELLVQLVIEDVKAHFTDNNTVAILDVGTGSGCIAIAIAKNLSNTEIIATDISSDALKIAEENIKMYNLTERIKLIRGNLFENLPSVTFDFIVSNPPYVTEEDYRNLPKSIREYEPTEALLAGKDGLDIIRQLIVGAKDYLKPEGKLIFEMGYNQADIVGELLKQTGYGKIDFKYDFNNLIRVVVASVS